MKIDIEYWNTFAVNHLSVHPEKKSVLIPEVHEVSLAYLKEWRDNNKANLEADTLEHLSELLKKGVEDGFVHPSVLEALHRGKARKVVCGRHSNVRIKKKNNDKNTILAWGKTYFVAICVDDVSKVDGDMHFIYSHKYITKSRKIHHI